MRRRCSALSLHDILFYCSCPQTPNGHCNRRGYSDVARIHVNHQLIHGLIRRARMAEEMPCGYDEDFLSPIDEDLQCSICYLALREPVLTRCGHRFCRECLERHMARFVFTVFCFENKNWSSVGK